MAKRLSTAAHTIELSFTSGKSVIEHHTRERDARQQLAWCVADNLYVGSRVEAAKLADSALVGQPLEVLDKNGKHVLTATITRTPKP